jgi:hypothetical protein
VPQLPDQFFFRNDFLNATLKDGKLFINRRK